MPKVKWGGQELQDRLENWEEDESRSYEPYDGPEPRKGVYSWKIDRMQRTKTVNGFPQVIVHLQLDPTKPEHQELKGFYMRDYVVVKDDGSTDFRIRPLLDALGVSVRDFLNNTIIGEATGENKHGEKEYPITKIGKLTIGGNVVTGYIWKPRGSEYFAIKYYKPKDAKPAKAAKAGKATEASADDSGDDGNDGDVPF